MAVFQNQARLTYSNGAVNSNIARGTILDVLSAAKNAVSGEYRPGSRMTFVVSTVNSGNAPVTGVTVSDDLGGVLFDNATVYPLEYVDGSAQIYVNGVLQTAPVTVTPGPPLVFSGITVPANSNLMIIYEADVTEFASPAAGSTVTNTATVTGTGVPTPLTAQAQITAAEEPELNILKSVEPTVVTENGRLTYTFEIRNNGSTEAGAGDAVVVSDVFDPVLSDLTVTLDGAPLTPGTDYTYTVTPDGGLFSTTAGRITVPAAAFTQNETDGSYRADPGTTTLVVSGTV